MPTRTSQARWQGDLKTGTGTLKLGSGAFEGAYSFGTRFENAPGTNPEELLAAAHAACYTMALNNALHLAGHSPKRVETSAAVKLEKVEAGMAIVGIALTTTAEVPGLDKALFLKVAEDTKKGCIVSRALSAVPMTLSATLA